MVEPVLTKTAITAAVNPLIKSVSELYKQFSQSKNFSLHNSQLISSLHAVGTVKTLFYGADKAVELNEFFINPKIKIQSKENSNAIKIHSLNDLKSTQRLLITGTVGQGKSIFMRYLALQELTFGKLPLFIEFKYVTKQKTLENLIEDIFYNWLGHVSKNDIHRLLNSGHITLFLDAFDELSSEFITDTTRAIETYCRDFPNLKIIVSSRPHHTISHATQFESVEVLPYEIDEQTAVIQKLVADQETQKTLIESIEQSSVEIQEVITTPLMVTLFVQKYIYDYTTPSNLIDFYANMFDVIVDKHNKTKTGLQSQSKSGLNNHDLETIWTRFCFDTCIKNLLVFERSQYYALLKLTLEKLKWQDRNIDVQALADDFQKYVCFILQDGQKLTFIHKSIQEFYAAKFISTLLPDKAEKAIDFIRTKIQSNRVILHFLSQLNPYYFDKFYFQKGLLFLKIDFKIKNIGINIIYFKESLPEVEWALDIVQHQIIRENFGESLDYLLKPMFSECSRQLHEIFEKNTLEILEPYDLKNGFHIMQESEWSNYQFNYNLVAIQSEFQNKFQQSLEYQEYLDNIDREILLCQQRITLKENELNELEFDWDA